MIQQPPENISAHFFWIAVPIILAFLLNSWLSNHAQKKQREEETKKIAEAQKVAAQKVADAITKRDDKLMYVLGEHIPHSHVDGEGEALTQPNIRYPKVKLNGGE